MPNIQELFPSRWLSASDLNGKDYTLVIRRVTLEEMRPQKGSDAEQKPVVWFNGAQKGMVLNKTNGVTIAKLWGNETDAWAGKAVTLYAAREKAFGAVWDVIRVRPTRPATPSKTHDLGAEHEDIPDARPVRVDIETGVIEGETRPVETKSQPAPQSPADALAAEYRRLYSKAVDLGLPLTKDGHTLPPAIPPTSGKLAAGVDYLRGMVAQAEQMADAPEPAAA